MDTFWIIWNEGNRAPTVRHLSELSARNEAEQLARNNPGQVFHVFVLVDSCRKVDVEWMGQKVVDDCPL
jgi:hypothetical protein